MNTHLDLEQRLGQLKGTGSAPAGLWSRIEAEIQAPAASASRHRRPGLWWGMAAVICITILALFLEPARHDPDGLYASPSRATANTVLAETLALDRYQHHINNQLPAVLQAITPLSVAYLNPELEAVRQARHQVRMALEQQPQSTRLLNQLTTLDQWQYQLIRTMNQAPGASA